jgi:hypothetical protein
VKLPAAGSDDICRCGTRKVAIEPHRMPAWPYLGLERTCPRCDPAPLVLVDVVRGFYRRVYGPARQR